VDVFRKFNYFSIQVKCNFWVLCLVINDKQQVNVFLKVIDVVRCFLIAKSSLDNAWLIRLRTELTTSEKNQPLNGYSCYV
jgi:hypothetical protein